MASCRAGKLGEAPSRDRAHEPGARESASPTCSTPATATSIPLILYNGREAGALEMAEDLAGDILRLCLRLGGSITGEHGVGMEKRAFLGEMLQLRQTSRSWPGFAAPS